MQKDYKTIITDNAGKFNDADALLDFIDSYRNADIENKSDVTGLEDNINEYADGMVPIYYNDIVKEWQENDDAKGATIEQIGEYNGKDDIYAMMSQYLFFYYQSQMDEDYQKLLDLLTK